MISAWRRRIGGLAWRVCHVLMELGRIGRLQLPPDLRGRIKKAYLQLVVFQKHDSAGMTADVAGYRVKFCTFPALMHLFGEIFVDQQYYFEATRVDPFIIDCGSNIGMSVLYFKMVYPGCEVLAFEPEERAFACLVTNIEANRLRSVHPHMAALADSAADALLYIDPKEPGSLRASTRRERMPTIVQQVSAVRLSDYITREVDFLKIDVEGSEGVIFEDLITEGKLAYVKEMAVEYHHHVNQEEDVLSHFLQSLEGAGFGYQVRACSRLPLRRGEFQDILVRAYRKAR